MLTAIKEKKAPKVTIITHKEIKILFNMTASGAFQRLTAIKATLGKSRTQKLSVFEFCHVEGFSIETFDLMYERAFNK